MDRPANDLNCIRRIVALLFALAVLAERAAGRPLAVRVFVHWLLRRAEFAALTLFIEPTDIEADFARAAPNAAAPCDLIRIATSLRALAMLLAAGCPAPSGGEVPPRLAMPRRGREVYATWRDASASQALPGPAPPSPSPRRGEGGRAAAG